MLPYRTFPLVRFHIFIIVIFSFVVFQLISIESDKGSALFSLNMSLVIGE